MSSICRAEGVLSEPGTGTGREREVKRRW